MCASQNNTIFFIYYWPLAGLCKQTNLKCTNWFSLHYKLVIQCKLKISLHYPNSEALLFKRVLHYSGTKLQHKNA